MRRLKEFRKVSAALLAVIVMAVLALVLTGCGSDDDDNSGGGGGKGGDSRLVTGSGEAWITVYDDYDGEYSRGFSVKSNGELISVSYDDDDHTWYGMKIPGGWYSNGDKLIARGGPYRCYGTEVDTVTYRVSGNSLTITSVYCDKYGWSFDNDKIEEYCSRYDTSETVYTKKNGIVPVMWGVDSRLVTGSGEAWVSCDEDGCWGMIFKNNGDCIWIEEVDDTWIVYFYGGSGYGEWYAAGGRVEGIAWCGTTAESGPCTSIGFKYSVNGNTLTTISEGWRDDIVRVFTKTSGINPVQRLGKPRQESSIPKAFFERELTRKGNFEVAPRSKPRF